MAEADRLGLEVALDFALQAAPDHPWATEHPEWFTTRADGTIAYAENPPKKYQDIYPINFDNDPEGIYAECERLVRHWMAHGVRIFRVDNPHTKPLQFWEWLLGRIRETDPDVIFLAEAFTLPPRMQAHGAIGFHQSYTHFTWRTSRCELEQYLLEMSHGTSHLMRPNFFVNTPDILHAYLQYGGPPAFKIRAVLAATGSPSWGVYAGYELCEHVAIRPGSEEYLDSEKYQIRIRDWDRADRTGQTLAPYLTRLNEVRRSHPALQQLRNVVIHTSDDDGVLVYSKQVPADAPGANDDLVIVVVNLDPHAPRTTTVHLNMPALGHGLERRLRRDRRDHRPDVAVGRAQLRAPRPPRRARPRAVGRVPARGPGPDGAVSLEDQFTQPDWFKTAVFYEVLVRSFNDSDGDGVGDFRGLTEKLDYLQWLGVDCLWVPPFFTSPLRDGGYDVADFTDIQPEVGTVDDFHHFLDEAHKRDIKVIIDFVMNHTSDAHPWFQASREDPQGPYGNFYVWSDNDDLYEEARIIFVDTEPSNWTWDPLRQQYFWHRFFSHQPDLNFDEPAVHDAILDAMRFWLDMGLDGFRLDAVPYLYERPGTNGENLKETHEFLKKVRSFVDENYPGRVLLCEANQWPSEVVEYFGDPATGGDECHMAFHFPVMPRIFMAVRRENRFPISEILEQTPAIPENCQWGIFLRNHDELTLEMVTDEDRDYMWGEYAQDPRMKANIGIRRRLAPLLDNDTNRMELFTALLLVAARGHRCSTTATRSGWATTSGSVTVTVCAPRCSGPPTETPGSRGPHPGRLSLPPIQDPVFGYQRVNVETELDNSSSLLHWTRRMIQARKQHPCFGLGEFHDLGGSNPSVLSYVRSWTDEDGNTDTVLCVNNLSRFPQPVELDLRRWEGVVPVELRGRRPLPRGR